MPSAPTSVRRFERVGGGEVAVARLINTQAVRLEVGRGRELRRGDFALGAECGDDFGGQKVRVDDHVPTLGPAAA